MLAVASIALSESTSRNWIETLPSATNVLMKSIIRLWPSSAMAITRSGQASSGVS